jgi:hypothetical protein
MSKKEFYFNPTRITMIMLIVFFVGLTNVFADEQFRKKVIELVKEVEIKYPHTTFITIDFSRLDSYDKLISSSPSVVPFIIEADSVLKKDQSNVRITLLFAYIAITKINYSSYENPWSCGHLSLEWYGGYELAQERFNLLQNKLKIVAKQEEKKMILAAMKSMGYYVLPFLVNGIRNGNEDYKAVFEGMLLQGTILKDKKTILDWWENNEIEYTPPRQNKEKFRYIPASSILDPCYHYTMQEKINKLYSLWYKLHIITKNIDLKQQDKERQIIALSKLIGYENTLQFRFLVDLGEEALPYLFLKLRDEKERFTLPVIEKIVCKKLSPDEIEVGIKLAELLLAKQEIEPKSTVSQSYATTPPPHPEIAKLQNKTPPVTPKIDFRTWQSTDNQFKTIAKFVSLDKWKVTLEKQDGKQTIVDIAILRKEDQDYIKNYIPQNSMQKTK